MAVQKYKKNVFVSIKDHKMTWDPNGCDNFDVIHTMEKERSGGHVDWFMPIFVGRSPNSVLVIDDVEVLIFFYNVVKSAACAKSTLLFKFATL